MYLLVCAFKSSMPSAAHLKPQNLQLLCVLTNILLLLCCWNMCTSDTFSIFPTISFKLENQMLHIKCHLKWAISFHFLSVHITSWKFTTNTHVSYLAKDIRITCQVTQPAHAQSGTYELADALSRGYLSHWNPDSWTQLLQPYQSALKTWQEENRAEGMNARAEAKKYFLTDMFLTCQRRWFLGGFFASCPKLCLCI